MPSWFVTYTTPDVEAETAEEAIERADNRGWGEWEAFRRPLPDWSARITDALDLQSAHVRRLRGKEGEDSCVCLGCEMARVLRGEETRK